MEKNAGLFAAEQAIQDGELLLYPEQWNTVKHSDSKTKAMSSEELHKQ